MDNIDIIIKDKLIHNYRLSEKYYSVVNDTLNSLPNKSIVKLKDDLKNKLIRIVVFIIALVSCSSLAVYAGKKIYDKYVQENVSIKQEDDINSTYSFYVEDRFIKEDMTLIGKPLCIKESDTGFATDFYYKKIYSYEDYINSNFKIDKLEISKDDFNNNFILIVAWVLDRYDGLNILEVTKNDDTLLVKIGDEDGSGNRFDNICVVLLNKDFDLSNINIDLIPGTKLSQKYGYIPISEISQNNIDEIIRKENWLTPNYNDDIEEKYEEMEKLDTFINTYGERMIRIGSKKQITDVIYKDGKYLYYHVSFDNEMKINNIEYIKQEINDEYLIKKEQEVYGADKKFYRVVYKLVFESMYHDSLKMDDEHEGIFGVIIARFQYKE